MIFIAIRLTGRDRNRARAYLLISRFPEPPCNPGQSDFPSPVLTLSLSSCHAFSYNPKLKCWHTYSPVDYLVYMTLLQTTRTVFSSPTVWHVWVCVVYSSAQRPFAPSRCYLFGGEVFLHLEEYYFFLIATTSSCASPKFSCFV